MANQHQIECFFKSADLAKLCKSTKDIIITVNVSYSEGVAPTFDISASAWTPVTKKAAPPKKGAKVKTMALSGGDPTPPPVPGCPAPCH